MTLTRRARARPPDGDIGTVGADTSRSVWIFTGVLDAFAVRRVASPGGDASCELPGTAAIAALELFLACDYAYWYRYVTEKIPELSVEFVLPPGKGC